MSGTEKPSVASRAVGAGAWTVGTRLCAKLIDLAMLLCLARFLGPAEFGLVAMAMAAVLIVEALFDLPMAAALIRVPLLTPDMLHTAFTLSLLRGLVVALLLLAVAWPLALFSHEPRLVELLAVLALAPTLRGLVNPRIVEYTRAFDFRPDAVMELSGKLVAFIVSVGIAVGTRSYWAIAAATVCAPLVSTLMSYFIAPLRPRLTLAHWPRFSNLVGWNFIAQLAQALNWQIDRLILPRVTTGTAFGQYAMGKQLAEIPVQVLIQPLVRPVMPALATAGDARASRYLRLLHAIAVVMAPVMGLAVLWPDVLVRLALGPGWEPAADWLRWVSVVALSALPGLLLGPLAMTLDRTRWLALRTLVELLVRLPLVWVGAMHWGIGGAVAGSLVATACGTVSSLFIVRRLIGASVMSQLGAQARPMAAMGAAGALLWLAQPGVLAASGLLELLARAAGYGLAYLLVYALGILAAWQLSGRPPGLEQHLLDAVRRRFARRGASAGSKPVSPRTAPDGALEAHVERPY